SAVLSATSGFSTISADSLWPGWSFGRKVGWNPSALPTAILSQSCAREYPLASLRYGRGEYPCDLLCEWCDGPSPSRRSFRKLNCKRSHQATVAVALFEKPFAAQRSACDPIEHVRIDARSNWFHEIRGQAITRRTIEVHDTQARIKTKCGDS